MARPKKSEAVLEEIEKEEPTFSEPKEEKKKESIEVVDKKKESTFKGKSIPPKLQKLIEEETKPVKGRFRCYETPGSSQKISCLKYPGVPMFEKVMTDGQMYTIPLYVARFLNGVDKVAEKCDCKIHTCSYPVNGYIVNDGKMNPSEDIGGMIVPIVGITKRNRRYGFESLEFDTE